MKYLQKIAAGADLRCTTFCQWWMRMSRPLTLRSVAERIIEGVPMLVSVSEFMDEFVKAKSQEHHVVMLVDPPPSTNDQKVDALLGAIAEYLTKQHRLPMVPKWASEPDRFLAEPWFTTSCDTPEMREYLACSSPAEFRNHNIFTHETPLTRAGSSF
jgi:hypothetical protein